MILSGNTWDALTMGSFPVDSPDAVNSTVLSYSPAGGLGLLGGYVLDSRFSELGREGRMIRLLQDTRSLPLIGVTKGIGIDDNTALVVSNSLTRPVGKVSSKKYSS